MDAELQFLYALAGIEEIHLSTKCPSGGEEAMKQCYNFKNFLMLDIDLFGQVSALQDNYSWRRCLPFVVLDDETTQGCCINTRENLF